MNVLSLIIAIAGCLTAATCVVIALWKRKREEAIAWGSAFFYALAWLSK